MRSNDGPVPQVAACDGTTATTSATGQAIVPGTLPIYLSKGPTRRLSKTRTFILTRKLSHFDVAILYISVRLKHLD